ncbi:hypothetical protein INS49_004101 [Diaporthe citri]|uniref:uncharacterized protein n=1 Tax=Diaporthe citri TaxID=83186 RepID=UPI001C8239FF|nr:uncharacterized protein INS49_004101 [Diaporthe citri]KAG6355020.1 hypothetical protein INS49_004101 [Diaporthe citri]
MLLEANYPTNDLVFGASPNFRAERILDMAHKVLDHSQGGETSLKQDSGGQRRVFSSESGIVAPLFALAAKCSDENGKVYMMLGAWPRSYTSSVRQGSRG